MKLMTHLGALLIALGPIWSVAPTASAQSAREIVGEVLDPNPAGSPKIKRTDGRVVDAAHGAPLFGGDHILVKLGNALNVRIETQRRTLSAQDTPLDFPVPFPQRGCADALCGIPGQVYDYVMREATSFAAPGYVRGANDLAPAPLVADSLAPSGPQLLPRGATMVAVSYRGVAGSLNVKTGSSDTAPVSTYGNSWAEVSVPPKAAGGFSIASPGGELKWNITFSDQPPGGICRARDDAPTVGARIARAICILNQGPPEWRLFALTELDDLSQSDFLAERFWNAAQAGRLGEALGAKDR